MKVAAVSGDARRALNICRRATEVAERRTSAGGKERLVGIKDVDAAVTEMFSSPYIMAMRCVYGWMFVWAYARIHIVVLVWLL